MNKKITTVKLLLFPVFVAGVFATGSALNIANASKNENVGSIVGQYNSKDKTTVGATLPNKSVSFSIPVQKGNVTYTHFAFMHAESGKKGWFFAPVSKYGVKLNKSSIKNDSKIDITNKIGLFSAPDKNTVSKVTRDDGKLKYKQTNKFLRATVKRDGNKYVIKITNKSMDDYKTPFSSGVWSADKTAKTSFDHKPSNALSKLATSGHRDALLKLAQK